MMAEVIPPADAYLDAARALLAHPELHVLRAERGDLAGEYADSASWQRMVHAVWADALRWAAVDLRNQDQGTCGCGCDCSDWLDSVAEALRSTAAADLVAAVSGMPGHASAPESGAASILTGARGIVVGGRP